MYNFNTVISLKLDLDYLYKTLFKKILNISADIL